MVSLATLIAERGGDNPVVGVKPLTCPVCRGKRTTFIVTAPAKGAD